MIIPLMCMAIHNPLPPTFSLQSYILPSVREHNSMLEKETEAERERNLLKVS